MIGGTGEFEGRRLGEAACSRTTGRFAVAALSDTPSESAAEPKPDVGALVAIDGLGALGTAAARCGTGAGEGARARTGAAGASDSAAG
jgi:hypothetical protein